MSKIMPIVRSQSSSHDFDHKRQSRREKKEEEHSSPAVINHIVFERERKKMKQLALPFDDDVISDVKIFELYLYSKSMNHRYRTYGKHVDYTLAETINNAEELFAKTYPGWWKSMGVREVDPGLVKTNLETLERQVETCKFVLEAFNIVK